MCADGIRLAPNFKNYFYQKHVSLVGIIRKTLFGGTLISFNPIWIFCAFSMLSKSVKTQF